MTDYSRRDQPPTAASAAPLQAEDQGRPQAPSGPGADLARQLSVAVSAVLAVAGAFVGSGAAGGVPIEDAAGGALSADATLLAPGGPAFGIWSVIYFGLLAYAVWQFLPGQRQAVRHRKLGYLVAASLLLNAAWILSVQFDQLWLSVPVIVVLLVVLARAFVVALRNRPRGALDALVTDGTIGLYLGWVCVATAANTAAVLEAAGFDGWGIDPEIWSVAVIAVAGLVGILLALYSGGRIAPALSLCWGLVWVGVARLTDEPDSDTTAVAAFAAAGVVLLVTLVARLRASGAHRGLRV